MKKLLRLLHVSDLHFDKSHGNAAVQRFIASRCAGALNVPAAHLMQGLQGHDASAIPFLKQSILDAAQQDAGAWQGRTYLACTGDISTWGDDASLKEGFELLEDLAGLLSLPGVLLAYGNHDVWSGIPGTHPLFTRQDALTKRRTAMRDGHLPGRVWIERTPVANGTAGGISVGICALNTVLHCRIRNALALGQLQHDFYWDSTRSAKDSQLDELERWLQSVDVALILSHHPVYDPRPLTIAGVTVSSTPPPLRITNVLVNRALLAKTLAQTPPNFPAAVRIVISGHTHHVYPTKLPARAPLQQHASLPGNLGQLIVGTCLQASQPSLKRKFRQTWQVLELSLDETARLLELRRIVYHRANALGPYVPRPERPLSFPL